MPETLDKELRELLTETNDQRRRFGQALWHFYRTLVFWGDRGLSFSAITKAWAAGGATIFDTMATTLRDLAPHESDVRLRQFSRDALVRLAVDLERGEHMRVSYMRWLEGRFPELTAMMRREVAQSRIFDYELAYALSVLFTHVAQAEPPAIPGLVREAARSL